MKFLKLKKVPVVPWSSPQPLNLRPRLSTLFYLCVGLSVFGLGEALLVTASAGVSPWTVLAQGVGRVANVNLGLATLLVSVCVLLFWIPLRQTPGIGTMANALIVSLVIELSLRVLPQHEAIALQLAQAVVGVLLVGLGSGIYLVANLGPGPRDGLMTGLARRTDLPIARVRTTLEIAAVAVGWSLGGTIGLGTVLFAFGIGPAVSLGLYAVGLIFAGADAD
mgnify:FL=1